MTSPKLKFPWLLFLITVLLLGIDLYFSLTNPLTAVSQKLGLASFLFRFILSISFTIPIFISMFFGAWSFMLLSKKPEFSLLANSIFILTLVLLSGVVLGVIRSHFFSGDIYGMYKTMTIIINYIYSFGYLIGFGMLLYSTTKELPLARNWNIPISIFIVILIGAFYSFILLTSPDRAVSSVEGITPSFFLPDLWIVLTIILPTLLGWFFAIWAAFRLSDIYGAFTTTTTTVTTKEGFKNVLYGVLFIVFSAIMLQAILSIGTMRFISGGLLLILVILYLFVALLTVGNFFFLKGARRLIQAT